MAPRKYLVSQPNLTAHDDAPPLPAALHDRGAQRLACFIVRDKNGQRLDYFYFEEEAGRREAANLLTKDEARRLAVNFAKLPDLLRQ